jgi:hypothetical protein
MSNNSATAANNINETQNMSQLMSNRDQDSVPAAAMGVNDWNLMDD